MSTEHTDVSPTTAYRINQNLRLLASAEDTLCGYTKLVALAKTLPGMEYEVERLTRTGDEVEADCEELREQLLLLGYDPD